VYHDRNLECLLGGSIRDSDNVIVFCSEGLNRSFGDVLSRDEGPRVSLPLRDSEVKTTDDVEKCRFYSTQKIQDKKLEKTLRQISPNRATPSGDVQ
jgi:hypothetical protein